MNYENVDVNTTAIEHAVPDWAKFLSNLESSTGGEPAEEHVHQELVFQMKLAQLAESRVELTRMSKLLVEFGATIARLLPSPTERLNALGGYGMEDATWAMLVSIPRTVDGYCLLTTIRNVCGVDESLWADPENETPFSITGRVIAENAVTFTLIGYGGEALHSLYAGLNSIR